MKKLITISFIICICVGCKIQEGKIVTMYFIPPHNENVYKYVWTSNGGGGVWVNEWQPDTTYYITIQKGEKMRDVLVYKKDWDNWNVGDSIELIK